MKKIPTVYARDWDGNPKYVTREVNPECQWVLDGAGVATRKFDGTCVLFDGARWFARREVKPGRPIPPNFLAVEDDPTTGKWMGWEPIEQSSFAKFHAEALAESANPAPEAWVVGTYELVGPKINRNPEGEDLHRLYLHADADRFEDLPLDYDGLRTWLHGHGYEGIVWHNADGRMAKLKAKDFPR